uniref:KIB1-4 beta-propeller domain-containing protein n=1 Tax=Aegilops tauschii TaxID=37682 RepID=M8C336_AEGTA
MAPEEKSHSQPVRAWSWSSIPLDLAGLVLRLLRSYANRARFAAVWFARGGTVVAEKKPNLQPPALSWSSITPATIHTGPITRARARQLNYQDSDKLHISKLVVCSPNLVAALVGIGYTSQILMCQPGALSWSVRAYDRCKRFEDMSFYQGKLYALTKGENLLVVNISDDHCTGDPQVSRIGQVIKGDPWYSIAFTNNAMLCKKLYLVESCGALLMVRRTIVCRIPEPGLYSEAVAGWSAFEVFKADFEHSRWISVSTVGANQVLFLGRRCSRAVSLSQYGVLGDQISFLDDDEENRMEYGYDKENASFGTYDIRSGGFSSVHPEISWKRCDEMRLAAWLFPHD